jgi:hypothetical protein
MQQFWGIKIGALVCQSWQLLGIGLENKIPSSSQHYRKIILFHQ